jgi:hypothetical protein
MKTEFIDLAAFRTDVPQPSHVLKRTSIDFMCDRFVGANKPELEQKDSKRSKIRARFPDLQSSLLNYMGETRPFADRQKARTRLGPAVCQPLVWKPWPGTQWKPAKDQCLTPRLPREVCRPHLEFLAPDNRVSPQFRFFHTADLCLDTGCLYVLYSDTENNRLGKRGTWSRKRGS